MKELTEIAKKQIKESFLPEYQHKITEEEGLGVAIATHLHWDPTLILKLTFAMFEDANMHDENETVLNWISNGITSNPAIFVPSEGGEKI